MNVFACIANIIGHQTGIGTGTNVSTLIATLEWLWINVPKAKKIARLQRTSSPRGFVHFSNKFSDEAIKQQLLFKDSDSPKENTEFMQYIDQMNSYETQIYFASQNTKKWSPMKQNMTSPKYTTNWYHLPKVN